MTATADFNALRDALRTLSQGYHQDQLKIVAVKDAVVLTTDDREFRWSLQVEAEVDDPGEIHVSFRRFLAHFQAFNGGQVHISEDDTSVKLTRDSVTGVVAKLDGSLFPPTPRLSLSEVVKKFRCQQASFATAVQACTPIVTDMDGYLYTSGIYLTTFGERGYLFATDRRQMIRIGFDCKGDKTGFTVDGVQMRRLVAMEGDKLEMQGDGGKTVVKNEYFLAVLANHAKNPPDVGPDLVKDAAGGKEKVRIPVPFMLEALSLANSVGGQRDNFFAYLDLGTEDCRLRAIGDREDEINVSLRCQAPRPAKIFFNHHYLLKSLSAFHRLGLCVDHFELRYGGPRAPMYIPFSEDCESLYVLMPLVPPGIKLDEEEPHDGQVHPAAI